MTDHAVESRTEHANLGLSEEAKSGIVTILQHVLADQVVLRAKTQAYHWNVTGIHFQPLHELFEEQYDELGEAIDETAEFIRSYGAMSIGTLAEFLQHTRLKEEPGIVPNDRQMIANLLADHEAIIQALRADEDRIDDEFEDIAAEDYLTTLLENHMKMAWKLRAHLG